MRTGYPILYTSVDSVLQLAMHESVIPLERQYEICRIARQVMTDRDTVARVIARPLTGTSGSYTRTENRRDFAVDPPEKTILNVLQESRRAT